MGNQEKENQPKKKPTKYVLTEEQISCIAAIAAEKGIESYKDEHVRAEKERQSRIKNNAKTLVINYRRFKGMCNESVYNQETTDDLDLREILSIMQGRSGKEYEVMSIKDRVVRTKMIMEHVDTMLEVYHKQCEKSTDPEEIRRWRVIEGLYLSDEPMTVRDIAEMENITTSTVYRDAEKAYRRLAILFFGIDGVKF